MKDKGIIDIQQAELYTIPSNAKYIGMVMPVSDKFVQQLKKGVLDMVVLKVIAEKDTYGYEIIQELERRGGEFFRLKEGTLYPVLYRLEDSGYICSAWQAGKGRSAPKKYYTITEQGRAAYMQDRNQWIGFVECVKSICGEAGS